MGRFLSKIILKIIGWKIETDIPEIDKCVVVGAPHTSNMDFYVVILFFISIGMKISFLIKKEVMVFPIKNLMRKLGAIPVDRSGNNKITEQLTEEFKKKERLFLIITPEGSRSLRPRWKRGFYYIAKAANVPILLGYVNYKYKTLGIGDVFYPTDDVEADMKKIKGFYKDKHAKYPEKFSVGDA